MIFASWLCNRQGRRSRQAARRVGRSDRRPTAQHPPSIHPASTLGAHPRLLHTKHRCIPVHLGTTRLPCASIYRQPARTLGSAHLGRMIRRGERKPPSRRLKPRMLTRLRGGSFGDKTWLLNSYAGHLPRGGMALVVIILPCTLAALVPPLDSRRQVPILPTHIQRLARHEIIASQSSHQWSPPTLPYLPA